MYPLFHKLRDRIVAGRNEVDPSTVAFINVGVDFGGNRSKTTFVAAAFCRDGSVAVVADHAIDGVKGFAEHVHNKY